MSDDLKVLQDHRDALLLAEVGALIHNIGKLSEEFLKYQAEEPDFKPYNYQAIVGIVTQLMPSTLTRQERQRLQSAFNANQKTVTSAFLANDHKKWLTNRVLSLPVPFGDHKYALGDFIEFQSFRWYKPTKGGSPPRITLLFSSGSRATELLEASHNAASGVEKEGTPKDDGKQTKFPFYLATAFGLETPIQTSNLKKWRDELLDALKKNEHSSPKLTNLEKAVGDTRRPINDVLLSDLSFSVAALFKSAMAQSVVLQKWTERDNIRWRLLRVNFDVLALYTKAVKIGDLLGYQRVVDDACEAVKKLMEEEYPLGNEVYRDTTGIYFTFPDLDLPADLAQEIRRRVEKVEPELAPRIAVVSGEGATAQEQLKGILGKARREALKDLKHPFDSANLTSCWQQLWETASCEKKWEVCPVCGLRPKEESAEVCAHCENRRKSRLDAWLKAPAQTIWLGEIADHNDRVALLVGKFGLDDWLSGNLVQTMLVKAVENDPGKCVSKNPSPARLRRVWETCQRFWEQTVQQEILSAKLGRRGIRKHIIPDKMNWQPGLYNGKVNSKPIDLFWQPEHNAFLTINNLQAAGAFKQGDLITLKRPESKREYEFRIQDIRQTPTRLEQYHPFLPLLASPDQFLAFVPAADALDIAQKIRSEYETQFGKVRNRLPLHLGVVYFERKMPLMAVMDTARQMLDRSSSPQTWQVKSKTDLNLTDEGWPSDVQLTLIRDSANIQMTVRTVMGDGRTPDVWYPYWRVEDKPTDRHRWFIGPDDKDWVHVTELEPGDRAQFNPSTFDFLWLDAAARRFELAYDKDGRRPSRPTKPYYLEDLDRLDRVWQVFSQLSRTQIKQILQTIETARERWNIPLGTQAESDEVFKQFVTDTLANAQWSKDCSWKSLGIASPPGLNTGEKNARPTRPTAARNDMQTKLTTAAVRGELTDLAELHLSILKEKPEEKE